MRARANLITLTTDWHIDNNQAVNTGQLIVGKPGTGLGLCDTVTSETDSKRLANQGRPSILYCMV